MAKISVKRFVELLQKSGLVPDTVLREALTQIKLENSGQPLAETDFVTRRLIEMEMITPWQCEKLLSQKYKGFFLGRYKILGHIGTGGMSSVYLVEHRQMHQRRAIKVLPRKRVADKTYLERFYIEARASASLEHPNIVRAFDVDHDKETDTHYLIMEYVDGRDVGKIVEEDGPVLPRDAASYIAQAANALQAAHDQGVVHRDVKPGNLLVDRNNDVKLLDLGLALFKEEDYSLTLEYNEKILGTADYLAPEQALNSHNVDYRADIYGLGCTLYFMLTGQPPFNEGSLAQRIVKHQTQEPPPIASFRDDCPAELQAILSRMMVKDPADRFQKCSEVSAVLEDWLAGRPVRLYSSASAGSPEGKAGSTSSQADSDVLSPETEVNHLAFRDGESVKSSAGDTIRESGLPLNPGSGDSASQSDIRLSAVSFSDIVAGSEIVSGGIGEPVGLDPRSPPTTLPVPAANAGQNRNSRSTIEVSPIFLVMIVLVSVFASSSFTVLFLDWLGILGS